MSKELTPEEFYKDTYGEDPPKIFSNTKTLDVFNFAQAYSDRILKQEREKQKELLKQAFEAGVKEIGKFITNNQSFIDVIFDGWYEKKQQSN